MQQFNCITDAALLYYGIQRIDTYTDLISSQFTEVLCTSYVITVKFFKRWPFKMAKDKMILYCLIKKITKYKKGCPTLFNSKKVKCIRSFSLCYNYDEKTLVKKLGINFNLQFALNTIFCHK